MRSGEGIERLLGGISPAAGLIFLGMPIAGWLTDWAHLPAILFIALWLLAGLTAALASSTVAILKSLHHRVQSNDAEGLKQEFSHLEREARRLREELEGLRRQGEEARERVETENRNLRTAMVELQKEALRQGK